MSADLDDEVAPESPSPSDEAAEGFNDPSAVAEDGELDLLDSERTGELDVERVLAEREEYLDALRRLQADFENFRKRTTRQQTDLLERASESLIVRLLPVLDALDLALAHAGAEDAASDDLALAQIASLLRTTFEKEGLERIDEVNVPFDPTRHDAVAHVERGEDEEAVPGGAIDEVLRAGYTLKGRVLRPAMVKVRG